MQVNDLGFVATLLFVLISSGCFFILLYTLTASHEGKQD